MVRAEVIEKLFDVIDETSMIISAELKMNYLHALCESCSNVTAQSVNQSLNPEVVEALEKLYDELEELEFSQEEVRKALQLGILKGLKAERLTNSVMTPDSLAMMVGYLISKFMPNLEGAKIGDLTVGTGNFLTAILNYLNKDFGGIYGVDLDSDLIKIAFSLADMQEHAIQFYQQSSLKSLLIEPLDIIIGDLPDGHTSVDDVTLSLKDEGCDYLPYLLIENHLKYLKPGGYAFYIVPNEIFNQPHSAAFHKMLTEYAHIQGLLQLPISMFKSQELGKSIFIVQRKGENVSPVNEVLLAELPRFSDANQFAQTLKRIEDWIKLNK
ncbi:MAG TPA: class I SAM-dependent methyltransferase [Firmicutes bacterium]|nr:class I SAM-dependent methyltransferase [Bacillota bacterium]